MVIHTWDFLLRDFCEMVDLALVGGLLVLVTVGL